MSFRQVLALFTVRSWISAAFPCVVNDQKNSIPPGGSRVLDIYEIQSHQLNLDRLKVLVVHLAVAFPV